MTGKKEYIATAGLLIRLPEDVNYKNSKFTG
jgi:hypothetical protein